MTDPTMPERMPIAAKEAIERIAAFRTWTTVKMYAALREALKEPHAWPAPMTNRAGGPPVQGS